MITRILIIFLISLIGSKGFSQSADSTRNYIFWSDDYQLIWTDFDELPNRYSGHSAYSVVGHFSELEITDTYYRATIRTYFDRSKSWSRNWVPILLAHEQGHFDLAELYARKFRKSVLSEMNEGTLTVESFEKLSYEIDQELKTAHNEYDEATDFSRDYRSQLLWNERIEQDLQNLSDFAKPELTVTK